MTTSPKRDLVARIMRARVARGDYPDGHHLSQTRLAAEFRVTRHVIWPALAVLQREGLVSLVDNRYLVNASHATQQLEGIIQRLDDIERLVRVIGRERLAKEGHEPYQCRRR
jgi:DNA-binding GntR family transcriptional regulator